MSGSYWKGAVVGLLTCLAVTCIVIMSRQREAPVSPSLQFDPAFIGFSEKWILPGESLSFMVNLRNLSRDSARIEEFRVSCPCATATIAGESKLPVQLASGKNVPVRVNVVSKLGERGRLELRYGVVAQVGDERVTAGALAEVRFVQYLNAEPPLLALGKFKQVDGKRFETVHLWFPENGESPGTDLTVVSDDPCVSALLERFPAPWPSLDGDNCRMIFARVAITVDPKIAPERLKAFVIIRSDTAELRIPVLGIIERPSIEEPAP